MKLKKILALLLALSMVFALVACSGSSDSDDADEEEETAAEETEEEEAAEEEEETAEEEEPAEEEEAEDEAPAGDVDYTDVDELSIMFSTTFYETETGGVIISTMGDYLSDITDGKMTLDVYWGGTLYGDADVLEGLSSGGINMTCFSHMPHIGTLNYLGFPSFGPNDPETALNMFNEVIFDNPETSALVQGELAENGIYFLDHGTLPGGANAYCTTYEFTDLDSLIAGSSSFGNMDATIFEDLGFQVTTVGPDSCYDSLQRGLIDSTQMGLTPMVSMQWYEVAPYWALDGTYSAGNFVAANLDWWNSLSENQQAAIQAAADYAVAYSYDMYSQGTDDDVATIEEATGNAFVEFSQEDIDRIWAASFEAKADSALEAARANGKEEGMVTILEVCAEVTGYDWTYEG